MHMHKCYLWLLIILINIQLSAEESVADSAKLAEINQRILDVFKGTEFDIDEETATSQTDSSPTITDDSQTSTAENSQISYFFKLEQPDAVWNSLDQFMFKELLDSCSQTLLNDIHNTIYLDTNENIQHASYKDRFTKLLLVGPQGSGKSSLSLAIAVALNRPYVFVSAASLANEYKNSAITIINNLFDPLIESGITAVVILDEITAFTKRFANKNDSDPGAVEHLWVKLDACKHNPNILVIFTANSTDTIPDTIKDRLSACEFHINHPDTNARKRILKHYLSEHCLFPDAFYNTLALKTKGFSLREINMLIARAKNKALNRTIRSRNNNYYLDLQKSDIETALKMLKTSHDAEIKRKNKEYYKEILSAVSPHIIPLISMLISSYLQIKFHNQQMEFTKHAHEQTMQHQRLVHWDTMTHMIENADRQYDYQTRCNENQKATEENHYQEQKEIGEKRYREGVETNEKQQNEAATRNTYQYAGTTLSTAIVAGSGGHPAGIALGAAAGILTSNIPEIQKNKITQIVFREIKNSSWGERFKFGFVPFYPFYTGYKTYQLFRQENIV